MKKLVLFDDAAAAPKDADDFTKKFNDAKLTNFKQDIGLRRDFSWATFALLCTWLFVLTLLLVSEKLPEAVQIALVSGATIKVIGLYYIVLRYIFPSRAEADEDANY